jgi:hypothetical protein
MSLRSPKLGQGIALISALLVGLILIVSSANKSIAQGAFSRCVAWHGGETWNIVNGQGSREQCFALARKCTGNPDVTATYYGSSVLVQAPYRQCTSSL